MASWVRRGPRGATSRSASNEGNRPGRTGGLPAKRYHGLRGHPDGLAQLDRHLPGDPDVAAEPDLGQEDVALVVRLLGETGQPSAGSGQGGFDPSGSRGSSTKYRANIWEVWTVSGGVSKVQGPSRTGTLGTPSRRRVTGDCPLMCDHRGPDRTAGSNGRGNSMRPKRWGTPALVALAIVATACTGGGGSASGGGGGGDGDQAAGAPTTLSVTLSDFKITPAMLSAPAGSPLTFDGDEQRPVAAHLRGEGARHDLRAPARSRPGRPATLRCRGSRPGTTRPVHGPGSRAARHEGHADDRRLGRRLGGPRVPPAPRARPSPPSRWPTCTSRASRTS